MGIRGLTTFIAKDAHKYMIIYELHDSYLVIDGNNIASHLYKWHCTRNDCFGGDYDKYGKTVKDFFKLLQDCNVTPIVVFDGGYEKKKLRTLFSRLKNRVKLARNLNSVTQGGVTMFPLFLRDLFAEIVVGLGVQVVRCDFEADYEMACLARSLNCPVLSYDSDFYVFDVLYIPFSTLEMSLRKIKNSEPQRNYLYCHMYEIENFLERYGGLSKSNLPLLAVLLGNDYISRSVFKNFYSHIKLPKRRQFRSEQQRRIISVIKWLQNETYESGVKKILGRLKRNERKSVASQIKVVFRGYVCKNSELLPYLNCEVEKQKETVFDFDATKVLDDSALELENIETEESGDEDNESEPPESDSCSESSECSFNLEIENEPQINAPKWFLNNIRTCEYPPAFVDILTTNTYFCTPQLEDYSNTCSHHISVKILAAINKILSSGNAETLTYVARTKLCRVEKLETPSCNIKLPKLVEVEFLSSGDLKQHLFDVLEIKSKNIIEFISSLPTAWQLYILSVIYWIRNAQPKVTYAHVFSIVLCMLVLNKVDKEIGFYRASTKFATKFASILKTLVTSSTVKKEPNSTEFKLSLDEVTYEDCLLCMNELIKYFQMDEKMKTHLKLFDIHVIDCFAQFQSCLLHIKHLNALLNKPFSNCIVSDFYDGTFLYNMCVNLTKRNDAEAYLSILLKSSSSVLNCFKGIVHGLTKALSEELPATNVGRKRRKKKKKKTESTLSDYVCNDVQSEGESEVDLNNRFYLLNLVK